MLKKKKSLKKFKKIKFNFTLFYKGKWNENILRIKHTHGEIQKKEKYNKKSTKKKSPKNKRKFKENCVTKNFL